MVTKTLLFDIMFQEEPAYNCNAYANPLWQLPDGAGGRSQRVFMIGSKERLDNPDKI